ncbi:hypothetical protein [Bradyrhizobium sp. SZCCHNRI2007]|uniref:hypothetical protein n=1 Tax=Bradyrhizobium sp. SZCCHNRI2007 TaxID=3057281 RepID=UPI0028EAC47B|nr:hypothetical protein [Bradyrhizobium sp. SZCCHNRI2007]
MVQKKVAPRLFVIFAREAHEAVIFRRGPSDWFHIVRWDTKNDKFHPGAWLKGRIYPEKCDLSPDGKLLLSFIHQGRKLKTDYRSAWSSISRSPWLHALGLWPQGTTYGGGGRFTDDRSAVLRFYPVAAHPDHPGAGLNVSFIAFDTSFERKYDLAPLHQSTREIEGAEWTGRDQRGRLIYAADGKLICAATKTREAICLADFNNLVPDPQPPPFSATVPLGAKKLQRRVERKQR